MKYADLARGFERLEATSGRLEMTAILVEMLGEVQPAEAVAVVRLLTGQVAPDWEGLEVGLAEKQIIKALAIATGGSSKSQDAIDRLEALYREKGDLGLAAETAFGRGGGKKQASLFAAQDLTVQDAFAQVEGIARISGTGSQESKQRLLAKLLVESSPLEARYLARMVAGRLRLGVADMTFLDALAAWHLGQGVRSVTGMEEAQRAELESVRQRLERAYDVCSDLAKVAQALFAGGMAAVDALEVEVGVPLRPMAAERLKTLPEILERMEGRVAMEYKYDGLRMQAHVPARGPVELFSRRMERMTAQFPEVTAALRKAFPDQSCIVEGEAVALDAAGRVRPFQDISRRRGRKTDVEGKAAEIPVTLFLFDCLAIGRKDLMPLPFAERRKALEGLLGAPGEGVRLSTLQHASDEKAMERFFDQAVEDGAEGIMCKDPAKPYKAGSRGFAWVKFKADYTEALVDTMDLVCIGAFHGRGRRAGWYGALLMAAYDPALRKWPSVCKLGTGFDDATLMGLKERFAPHAVPAQPDSVESGLEPDVWLDPQIVMEVQAAELTLSPTHRAAWGGHRPDAGLAARFPRFTKWRPDKGPTDATTVAELEAMFKQQHGR